MSFLSKLFGSGSGGGGATGGPVAEMDHEGYKIIATPQREGDHYRLHGTISKVVDGEEKTHTLIRADLYPAPDDCVENTFRKAKQVIKEQGDRIFG